MRCIWNVKEDLRAAFAPEEGAQSLDCEIAATVQVSTDQAVSIGMIATELVVNAFKHSGAGDRPGKVFVRWERSANEYRLVVADDGRGLPPDFDPEESAGLGMLDDGAIVLYSGTFADDPAALEDQLD
jgi:two-component sensor histidine kinase